VTLSEDLAWEKHHNTITAYAYKTLGLIQRTFVCNHSPPIAVCILSKILITLLHPPHLMKDILVERVQRCSTKHNLEDYAIAAIQRLKLKLLPLMYIFELQDILAMYVIKYLLCTF